jgi:hypothetical protein
MRFWVESSELWIANEREVVWHGRPDGKPVVRAVALPGTEDAFVLLDGESGPRTGDGSLKGWPHLLRIGSDGCVVWRIEPGPNPGDPDWWIDVVADTHAVWASTWSGYRRRLDPSTGLALESTFTK